ncbi:MAG: PH domain-containing protein [Patescibacteria group bacterium]|nr:PH domain-containing protein [Patescibacteria group bacterium]
MDIKLKEKEKIVSEVLQYGLTKIWGYFSGFACLVLASFFMFWFFDHDWWGISLFSLLLFCGFFIIFRNYYLWKKNVFYITTHRLIDSEQRGFFERIVSEIPYDQIEDVHGKIKGFFGIVLRFGNVTIQTGSGKVKIVLSNIKRPLQLQQHINEMRESYLSKNIHNFSGDIAEAITNKLYELELPDLYKVKKVLDSRLNKLSK